MRDQVFSGASIDEALALAARTLGLPRESLRYVVLDPGRPGARGLSATPARVAVMYDDPAAARPGAPAPAFAPGPDAPGPVELLLGVLELLEDALEAPLGIEVRQDEEQGIVVRLQGPGCRWLLERDADPLAALDHLLRRALQAQGHPARLVLWCEGWRERRDERLRERAQELARAVREDGQARRMEPLNSYERRVVHMAVAEVGGLTTYSEGEGHERAVTIAPAPPAEPG
jgi:spoIIIJ-associated protein